MNLDTITCADIFDLCATVPDGAVDMILCDLPYGTTACSWDTVIPFEPMWKAFKRIIKPRGAIVLTASQPFTSALVMSNPGWFRYEWVWNKVSPVGFLNVHNRPMMQHESILIFADGIPNYTPQLRVEVTRPFGNVSAKRKASGYGESGSNINYGVGYPLSILKFARPNNLSGGGLHPNQKPIKLFEYLIRTYTQPGELVFDPCCGSGTTAIAARRTERHFICGDSSPEYVAIANERLQNTDPFQDRKVSQNVVQHSLFQGMAE